MKIAIDVTPLPRDPVGAGVYIIQLVRAMAALPTKHQFLLIAQPSGRSLIGELPEQNVEWVMAAERSPAARLVWEQAQLPGLVTRLGVELLHSLHYTRPYTLSCKSVVTFHDMTFFLFPEMHTVYKRLFFPLAIRMSARRADAIITVSESTRRDALRILELPTEKIISVPNGISPEFRPIHDPILLASCRNKYRLPEKFILFVGLIEPRKNLPLLLKSYARLLERGMDIPLVLVGRLGWMYKDIFRLVRELELEGRAYFSGYIPTIDLPAVYNLAQAFVYPSNYEGFGFPPLGAMACGTPVITTAISAMADNVGEAGLLVPPHDEESLTNALQTLLSDHAYQERLSQAGRLRAAEFTWERSAKETMRVYERAG